MEMQQIAESIVRVTKRIPRRRLNCGNLRIILNAAERNRPAILKMYLQQRTAQSIDDFVYLIEFDPMICLDEQWIDGETLRYFNSLRTNILINSTKFDKIQLTDHHNRQHMHRRQQPIRRC
jgi:GTP-binding protein EngB required for normal cell division